MDQSTFKNLFLTETQLVGSDPCPDLPSKLLESTSLWPEYEIVAESGCDCVVCRHGDLEDEFLILLPSRRQAYLRSEDAPQPTVMTPDTLSSFLSGDLGDGITGIPWVSRIDRDRYGIERFCELLQNDAFCALAQRGLVRADWGANCDHLLEFDVTKCLLATPRPGLSKGATFLRQVTSAIEAICGQDGVRIACGKACGLTCGPTRDALLAIDAGCSTESMSRAIAILSSLSSLRTLESTLGLDCMRKYVEAWSRADRAWSWSLESGGLERICETIVALGLEVKPKRFVEYAIDDRISQTDGVASARWLDLWADTLCLQDIVRGEVTDKYPRDLIAAHDTLIREGSRVHDARQEDPSASTGIFLRDPFARRMTELGKNEFSDDRYMITVPRSAQEIIDEGRQQHNCVAGFVAAFKAGKTDLYFMRERNRPDRSLITVEVRDNTIRQAFSYGNGNLNPDELQWLDDWCDRCGIRQNHNHGCLTVGIHVLDRDEPDDRRHEAMLAHRQEIRDNRVWAAER